MTLEVKRCMVWNDRTQTGITPRLGAGESFPDFFARQDELDLRVDLEIGPKNAPGTNLFSLRAVSVEAVQRYHLHLGQEKKSRHLVLHDLTWHRLEQRLLELVASCQAPTWEDSVEQLRRHFDWEYEGYIAP